MKSIADMDDKELMEYFRELERKGEGKSVSIEQLKEDYYKCQRLAVQTGRIAKQTAKQRDSLFELLQSALEEIRELKKIRNRLRRFPPKKFCVILLHLSLIGPGIFLYMLL